MRAYYFDNLPGDQRLPHDAGIPVDDNVLTSVGFLHWHVPVSTTGEHPDIDAVARERDYKHRDVITLTRHTLGDLYELKLKSFYAEHMHEEEEIRYVLDGSGFFDVREHRIDKWIRCAVDVGDLVVIPAGMYHRFTLDENNMMTAMRLFKDEPKWMPHNRDEATDINPFRVEYLKSIAVN